MDLKNFVKHNRVYLDGAIGSELIKMGFDTAKAELLNLTNPDILYNIHKKYYEAGSNIIYTNTFGCNQLKFDVNDKKLEEMILSAIEIANKARNGMTDKFIAYDCGPLPEMLAPYGKLTFDESYNFYKNQAEIIKNTNIDLVVIETMTDTLMLKSAILAFSETVDFPIWCSMSFDENGRTFNGSSIGSFALIAQGMNVDAIGINCSLGPDKMKDLSRELIKYAHVPIFIKPNAGMPKYKNGQAVYDIEAGEFSSHMAKIASYGVSILGGCCGTNPNFIKKTIAKTKDIPYKFFKNNIDAVCSATKVVPMKSPLIIGERINPTGKPKLKQAIIKNNYDYIKEMATDQIEKGADILDINVGMSGINETQKICDVIANLQSNISCPIQIDSSRISAIEKALRIINGVPIINSVSGDDESLENILPLAKKYGAYIVCICLDKDGIPKTADGRIKIAKKIIARAKDYGIKKEKLLIDALTLSVSVNTSNGLTTLETVKKLNEMGYKTILGLSNVSFGLPQRDKINSTFYRMAIDNGVFALIINPAIKPNVNKYAKNLLLGKDTECKNYIKTYGKSENTPINIINKHENSIKDCVVKGLKTEGFNLVKIKADKNNYNSIIENEIIKGLNILGKMYETGQAFLPQLIASAECANAMLDYIKTKFIPENSGNGHKMLIATVKGDIHDIGKNIVKAVLSNYGFHIIDLGKDVSINCILKAIKKYNPQIVGLSALMTTTLDSMAKTVEAIKNYDKNIIVMVGGAVVTQEFAQQIGADIYSVDAQDAVKKLNQVFEFN